jgi:hypothetical protein
VSYRDDQEALHQRLEGVEREAERLRRENEAMRVAVGGVHAPPAVGMTFALPPGAVYRLVDVQNLPLEERARLAAHTVRPFPAWAVAVLNVVTLGLFPLIHFGLQHDRMPRAVENDPGAGKAIGFTFIPYYNFYWIFFNALRLCDRLDLQLKLRARPERSPRGLVLAACILSVIPYVNLVIGPILWTIVACFLQSTINRVAALSPTDWDATVPGIQPGMQMPQPPAMGYPPPAMSYPPPPMGYPGYPGYPANMVGAVGYVPPHMMDPMLAARAVRARKLVVASHVLGWGGLALALVGGTGMGAAAGVGPGFAVGGIGMLLAVVGAILGQVGRGLQGRAI